MAPFLPLPYSAASLLPGDLVKQQIRQLNSLVKCPLGGLMLRPLFSILVLMIFDLSATVCLVYHRVGTSFLQYLPGLETVETETAIVIKGASSHVVCRAHSLP